MNTSTVLSSRPAFLDVGKSSYNIVGISSSAAYHTRTPTTPVPRGLAKKVTNRSRAPPLNTPFTTSVQGDSQSSRSLVEKGIEQSIEERQDFPLPGHPRKTPDTYRSPPEPGLEPPLIAATNKSRMTGSLTQRTPQTYQYPPPPTTSTLRHQGAWRQQQQRGEPPTAVSPPRNRVTYTRREGGGNSTRARQQPGGGLALFPPLTHGTAVGPDSPSIRRSRLPRVLDEKLVSLPSLKSKVGSGMTSSSQAAGPDSFRRMEGGGRLVVTGSHQQNLSYRDDEAHKSIVERHSPNEVTRRESVSASASPRRGLSHQRNQARGQSNTNNNDGIVAVTRSSGGFRSPAKTTRQRGTQSSRPVAGEVTFLQATTAAFGKGFSSQTLGASQQSRQTARKSWPKAGAGGTPSFPVIIPNPHDFARAHEGSTVTNVPLPIATFRPHQVRYAPSPVNLITSTTSTASTSFLTAHSSSPPSHHTMGVNELQLPLSIGGSVIATSREAVAPSSPLSSLTSQSKGGYVRGSIASTATTNTMPPSQDKGLLHSSALRQTLIPLRTSLAAPRGQKSPISIENTVSRRSMQRRSEGEGKAPSANSLVGAQHGKEVMFNIPRLHRADAYATFSPVMVGSPKHSGKNVTPGNGTPDRSLPRIALPFLNERRTKGEGETPGVSAGVSLSLSMTKSRTARVKGSRLPGKPDLSPGTEASSDHDLRRSRAPTRRAEREKVEFDREDLVRGLAWKASTLDGHESLARSHIAPARQSLPLGNRGPNDHNGVASVLPRTVASSATRSDGMTAGSKILEIQQHQQREKGVRDRVKNDFFTTTTTTTTTSTSRIKPTATATPTVITAAASAKKIQSQATTATTITTTVVPPAKQTKYVPQKVKDLEGAILEAPKEAGGFRFKVVRLVQTAIYGGVYLGSYVSCPVGSEAWRMGTKAAIKIMFKKNEKTNDRELQEDPWAELKFRKYMIGHPNVLVCDTYWDDEKCVYLIMPFAEHEDLFEYCKKRQAPFSEEETRWLFSRILMGAAFLNERGVGFRDHSLENVLLFVDRETRTLIPRITDPGQAVLLEYDERGRRKELRTTHLFGKSFRPPEVYLKRQYDPLKVDTFCLGWMMFFCLTHAPVFHRAIYTDKNWLLFMNGKKDELFQKPLCQRLSQGVKDLLGRMLDPDYRHRPTPAECLEDTWFAGAQTPIYVDESQSDRASSSQARNTSCPK